MSTEPDIIAAFLRCGRRPVTMDNGCVETSGLMKPQYGAGENGVKTAIGLPSSKGALNARIMNLGLAILVLFDRQLFPRAAQVKLLQNGIEDCVQGQLWSRTAAAGA
jgi:hypothetical protein